MRRSKPIALLVIAAFLVQVVLGTMVPLRTGHAFDNPEKDDAHDGSAMVGNEGRPAGEPCPARGSPVNLKSGDYEYSRLDLLIPGLGPHLEITRTYNSQDTYDGPFGYGWKFNLEVRLLESSSGGREVVTIRRGDGVRFEFIRKSDGSYQSPLGRQDSLVKHPNGSFTWTDMPCNGSCGSVRHEFSTAGYLSAVEDPSGNTMTFSYDAGGKLTQVKDASGRKLLIKYNADSKIRSITDPADRVFSYRYDLNGNLSSFTDPAGNVTAYAYDGAHNLTSVTNARGNIVTAIAYDAADRVSSYTEMGTQWTFTYDPEFMRTSKFVAGTWNSWSYTYNKTGLLLEVQPPVVYRTAFVYDGNLNVTSVTDARGYTTTFQYDERDNRTGITDALGNTTTFTYHPALNKVTSVTDTLGRVTRFQYDNRGNLTRITDAQGHKTRQFFNDVGLLTKVTDALGSSTQYAYDSYGNLSSITDALGNVTAFSYDILGNLTAITDPNGAATTLAYDAAGNLVTRTDALGSTTTYAYDKSSNLVSVVDPLGNTAGYEYDVFDRLTRTTDALGNAGTRTYDGWGNLTAVTDGNGNTFGYTYDYLHRLTKTTFPDGSTNEFTYDGLGNLLTVKDGKGNVTSFVYDELNRPKEVVFANGAKESYSYSKVGKPVGYTDRKGNTFTFAYDDLNRLVSKTYPDASQSSFGYDVLGRLTTAGNASSQLSFTYDALGRVLEAGQGDATVGHAYDKVGNPTTLTYPDGTSLTYAYDALNRLDQLQDAADALVADYAYDSLSRRTKLTLANGVESTYQFDAASRLLSLAHRKLAPETVVSSFTYAYDQTVNVTSMTTLAGTHTYTYDKTSQLTQISYPAGNAASYSYDAHGNRTTVVNGGTAAYNSNNLDQYTDIGGVTLVYDANGNLLSDGTNSYTYDFDNRLVQVVTPLQTVTYGYDPLGRRISRSAGGAEVKFLHDGDRVIEERGTSGKVVAQFFYGVGIDEIVVIRRPGNDYYSLRDGLGNVAALTDASGGKLEGYEYDVYGKPFFRDKNGSVIDRSAFDNAYLFTGRDYDDETGLYHFRARWYDPDHGRFLTPDPLGIHGGDSNLYRYVWNNPAVWVDPHGQVGLFGAVVGGIIGAVGGYMTTGTLTGTLTGAGIGAAAGTIGQFGASWYGAMGYGALAGGGSSLAFQTLVEGKSIKCLDWWEVGFATGLGGAFGAIFGGAPRVSPTPVAQGTAQIALPTAKAVVRQAGRSVDDLLGFLTEEMMKGKAPDVIKRIMRAASDPEGREVLKAMANRLEELSMDPNVRQLFGKKGQWGLLQSLRTYLHQGASGPRGLVP